MNVKRFGKRFESLACHPDATRGRRYAEVVAPTRDNFQRDRDRIVHSTAFRRLVYKTQVFLNHEGDLFRTRLTHTLEVAQLSRSIARTLGLNEDLCEAIALAHDLGHTPFGHAGQDELDACLRRSDPSTLGFEHNFQSLRVVDTLEERYPDHDGLNLTFETREGILKHCSRRRALQLDLTDPSGIGRRFIEGTRPSLEAQVCNIADEIAYNTHDVDDGERSGLLARERLLEIPLFARFQREALDAFPALGGRRLLYATLRRMLSAQVEDVVDSAEQLIGTHAPSDAEAVRACPTLIAFNPEMASASAKTKAFLMRELYRHPQVVETTASAKLVVRELFEAYVADPAEMPTDHATRAPVLDAIADYIAGMTDRFALREHRRLTGRIVHFSEPPG